MLNLHTVHTDGAPAAIGPYSQGVAVNVSPQGVTSMLATAGQVGLDPASGEMVKGGVQAETERALLNLGAILAANDMTLANVVKTTVFLADMQEFAAMNEVYAKFFPGSPPARSTVAVAGLPKNARVEVEAWAARVKRAPRKAVRLTTTVECAGCAAKFAPGDLAKMLKRAGGGPRFSSPRVLVGPDTWDDAGVYSVTPGLAMVQTVDFFTPILDDPADYGAVAAANAVSDVYAMGGVPVTALCLVGAPAEGLPEGTLGRILKGGERKLAEAGVVVLGGHSIKDKELKFGYAVTGWVHPRKVITNAGARPGDVLVLTKPLGTGVYTTALKRGLLGAAELRRVTRLMSTLNAGASRAMRKAGARAATDVTGYGLLGHARNVAAASGVTLEIDSARVPLLPGVEDRIAAGCFPGGLTANHRFVEPLTEFAPHVAPLQRQALCDPQTSGGLLIAVPAKRLAVLLAALRAEKVREAQVIGRVLPAGRRLLRVV